MLAAIGPIISLIVSVLGWFLNKAAVDAMTKKSFLDFVTKLEERQLASAATRQSVQDQIDRLNKGE